MRLGRPLEGRDLEALADDRRMPYEMRDNSVQEPEQPAAAAEAPDIEPGKIYDDAMSRLESITQEWAEVVRSVRR